VRYGRTWTGEALAGNLPPKTEGGGRGNQGPFKVSRGRDLFDKKKREGGVQKPEERSNRQGKLATRNCFERKKSKGGGGHGGGSRNRAGATQRKHRDMGSGGTTEGGGVAGKSLWGPKKIDLTRKGGGERGGSRMPFT